MSLKRKSGKIKKYLVNSLLKLTDFSTGMCYLQKQDMIVKTVFVCRALIRFQLYWKVQKVEYATRHRRFAVLHRETVFTVLSYFLCWIWFCKLLIPVEESVAPKINQTNGFCKSWEMKCWLFFSLLKIRRKNKEGHQGYQYVCIICL